MTPSRGLSGVEGILSAQPSWLCVLGSGVAQQRGNHPPAPSLVVLKGGRVFRSPTDNPTEVPAPASHLLVATTTSGVSL